MTIIPINSDQQLFKASSPTFVGLSLSSISSGSVLFAGTNGVVSGDFNSLNWDSVNRRLGINAISISSFLQVNGDESIPSWTTTPPRLWLQSGTYTDTTGSGTVTLRVSDNISASIFASTSAVTVTDGVTLYITGPPTAIANTTITRPWSLMLGSGNTWFKGNLFLGTSSPNLGNRSIGISHTFAEPASAGVTRGVDVSISVSATTIPATGDYFAFVSVPSILASNTQNWTNATGVGGIQISFRAASGSTGTATNVQGLYLDLENNGSMTWTNAWGLRFVTPSNPSGTITNLCGAAIAKMDKGTNNTTLLLGTTTIPSGNHNVYSTQGTLTTAIPAVEYLATWNNGAVVFTAFDMNITDTASDPASLFMNLRKGGTSQFSITKGGLVQMNAHYGAITADTDGATITFDASVSDRHKVTLGGNRTLALSNDTIGQAITLIITQDGTGSRTVTWWSGIKWQGGTVPTLTTTASKTDVFSFIKTGAGAYLGFAALNL